MPPLKQPLTLWDAALNRTAIHILELCKHIEDLYSRDPDTYELMVSVVNLRVHLNNEIGPVLENVYARLMEADGLNGCEVQLQQGKILFDVLMNKKMKLFFVNRNKHFCEEPVTYDVLLDTVFWNVQLAQLEMVVNLDLSFVKCTDEMLTTIAANCRSLEKIKVCSIMTWSMCPTFSAKYLLKLVSCEKLRKVKDIYNFAHIDASSMQLLLRALPNLQVVSHRHIGELLEGMDAYDIARLRLTHFVDIDVEPEFVACMLLLKHLRSISLGYSSHSHKTPSETLSQLTKCSLVIPSVNLNQFTFDRGMENFLLRKGKHITSLNLSLTEMDYEDVLVIGEYCTNIEIIELDTYFTLPDEENLPCVNGVMFDKLKSLTLKGNIVWELFIVQIFLNHALRIESIHFHNDVPHCNGNLFLRLSARQLTELKTLNLYGRYTNPISDVTLISVLKQCSKLIELRLDCPLTKKAKSYLELLKREIVHKNFNLKLTLSSDLNDSICTI